MAKHSSFLGNLKRLFKAQQKGADSSPRGSLEDRAICKLECPLPDIDILGSISSPSQRRSYELSKSPLPKTALHRKLLAFKSGPLTPAAQRMNASQALYHHSKTSDACDAPSIQTLSCRTSSEDAGWIRSATPVSTRMGCGVPPQPREGGWCTPRPMPIGSPSLIVSPGTSPTWSRALTGPHGPTHSGPHGHTHVSNLPAHHGAKPSSEAALPALSLPSDAATLRYLCRQGQGGDASGCNTAVSEVTVHAARPLSEVQLPSVTATVSHASHGGSKVAAAMAAAAAPSAPPPIHRLSGELPRPQPAAPASAPAIGESTLLSMCPGTPQAMRRPKWSLQDFIVSRRIYKGSTSAVYKATCRYSGMPVALKVYFLSRVPANVIHMILREIKIHTGLVHDNIIMLYAAFQEERRLVLVQEYAARGDLHEVFRGLERDISEAQLAGLVLAPFLDGLSALHGRGICHRDIKPENILLTQDWRCAIADFGVSVDLAEERAVTRAGTLEYMAPEVERCPLKMFPEENKEKGFLAYTTAVDIWATGVLAYELLVGFPPFRTDAEAPNSTAATRGPLHFPPHTSAAARDFIRSALAERPEDRPTAAQLRRHPWIASASNANRRQ